MALVSANKILKPKPARGARFGVRTSSSNSWFSLLDSWPHPGNRLCFRSKQKSAPLCHGRPFHYFPHPVALDSTTLKVTALFTSFPKINMNAIMYK